jgi:hypothetical protein
MATKPTRLSDRPLSYLNNEHLQQAALIDWTKRPEVKQRYPLLEWLYAVPNGGDRVMAVAVKLKAEGLKSGVWDLFLPIPRSGYHGFYIEMKYGKNALSPEQVKFGEFVIEQGYKTAVFYCWLDARDALIEYLEAC